MSFAEELKKTETYASEAKRREEIEKKKENGLHGYCLEYIKGQIKGDLTISAKQGLLREGTNKGYLLIGTSSSPYVVHFCVCSELRKPRLKDYRKRWYCWWHGPNNTKVDMYDYRFGEVIGSARCSAEDVVMILQELGFSNVSYEVLKHRFNYRVLDTKYKGIEEGYYYSFMY